MHSHNKQTEVFYTLQGECSIFIDGKEYIAKPGDAFICNPEDKHNLWNRSNKDFKLVVFKINLPEGNDTIWEE